MSTKGWEDGYCGDENDVVYGPTAMASRAEDERKAAEFLMRPISSMSYAEIEAYVAKKKHDEERAKNLRLIRAKDQLAVAARGVLQLNCVLPPDEARLVTEVLRVFGK